MVTASFQLRTLEPKVRHYKKAAFYYRQMGHLHHRRSDVLAQLLGCPRDEFESASSFYTQPYHDALIGMENQRVPIRVVKGPGANQWTLFHCECCPEHNPPCLCGTAILCTCPRSYTIPICDCEERQCACESGQQAYAVIREPTDFDIANHWIRETGETYFEGIGLVEDLVTLQGVGKSFDNLPWSEFRCLDQVMNRVMHSPLEFWRGLPPPSFATS